MRKIRRLVQVAAAAWRAGGWQGACAVVRDRYIRRLPIIWARFWMQYAGLGWRGRLAARLAAATIPGYYGQVTLVDMNPLGYVSPNALLGHRDVRWGRRLFVGPGVILYQDRDGGPLELGDGVRLHLDTILQTGEQGRITIGRDTHIHPRCILSAYKASIHLGADIQVAPQCVFYPYDHGTSVDDPIEQQPLQTKGDIVVEDGAWLGTGVIVLSGVRIGAGAVVGAGSIVTQDVPAGGVAAGVPARLLKMRRPAGRAEDLIAVPGRPWRRQEPSARSS